MSNVTELSAADRELFRDNFRKFLANEVEPHYAQWEKDEIFPRELWNKLGENGYLCVDVPEAYGGYGADFSLSAIVVEELGYAGYGALMSSVSVHSDIVAPYIFHLGTEEQKQQWLPKMVSGEAVGAIAMTEPGAGSDLQAMRTSAVKQGANYVINGYLNSDDMVERVETWLGDNIMGDMRILAEYSGWQDLDGAMVPSRIVQTRGGWPFFEVDVTSAAANPADVAGLVPAPPANGKGKGGGGPGGPPEYSTP